MVELLTNFNLNYVGMDYKSKFISAIVPRSLTQTNFITGYSDSAVNYQHSGESFILSSIRTRILGLG